MAGPQWRFEAIPKPAEIGVSWADQFVMNQRQAALMDVSSGALKVALQALVVLDPQYVRLVRLRISSGRKHERACRYS